MRIAIPLSTEGDEQRIIKHADIYLFEITEGWWLWKEVRYEAVHRPTGLTSRNL